MVESEWKSHSEWLQDLRLQAIKLLSPWVRCQCQATGHGNHPDGPCMFNDPWVLEIDHIWGHLREESEDPNNLRGSRLVKRVIQDGLRSERYQVLCPTCHRYKTKEDIRKMNDPNWWPPWLHRPTEEEMREAARTKGL